MAAYAALVSLTYVIEQIQHHPCPPISLDEIQVESLTKNVTFLQEFLEGYDSHVADYSKEVDLLEIQISDAAYSVEDAIESHIVDVILGRSTSDHGSVDLYQHLQKEIEDMEFLKKQAMEIAEKRAVQHDQLPRNSTPAAAAASLGSHSVVQNTTMVGFDDILIEVMDKLTGGQPGLQIIPIVGMGGIGKTTLARNIYHNRFIAQHFDILVWVTISQEYRMREILLELVHEGGEDTSEMNEYELQDKIHKRLYGRRYLIIVDDIWSIDLWDQLRMFFPDNKNGSQIVITTRISNMQLNASYVLNMGFLDEDKSWSLFAKIVFGEQDCPLELEEIGRKIVENCRGLPLTIVVVGGLLLKSERTQRYWEYVVKNMNAIVNSDDDENCMKILYMSYSQLPVHLKPCFLYMGIFPEDKKLYASEVVKLWVAEGFLKPIRGKSWEEVAYEYLKELINRNLILVRKLGCTGNIKYCNIHDLFRSLCLREAHKERFYNVLKHRSLDVPQNTIRRCVVPNTRGTVCNALQYRSCVRSLICDSPEALPLSKFSLLRIMSCANPHFTYRLEDMFQLVNARFLALNALWYSTFPRSVNLLWNLHTFIVYTREEYAPTYIWNLSQLRHFEFGGGIHLPDPPIGGKNAIVLRNLQTFGKIVNFKCCEEVVKRIIPNIKRLVVDYHKYEERYCLNNLAHLQKLESFYCMSSPEAGYVLQNFVFPHSLKKLTIAGHLVHWEDMLEKIELPLLQKLVLRFGSFRGRKWETVEGQFPSLKSLKLVMCSGLEYWSTEGSHFPCLERLQLAYSGVLKEIPLEIAEITTLKLIKLASCSNSVVISAKKVVDEQEVLYGEVGIQVRVATMDLEQKEQLWMLGGPNFRLT